MLPSSGINYWTILTRPFTHGRPKIVKYNFDLFQMSKVLMLISVTTCPAWTDSQDPHGSFALRGFHHYMNRSNVLVCKMTKYFQSLACFISAVWY